MANQISNDSTSSEIYGLVLAGGRSSRMGQNKALIEYHGIPQIEFIYHLLSNHCSEVFVSAKKEFDYPGYPIIKDHYHFESPLNGILSALNRHPDKTWLVLACDMPFVSTVSIEHLIAHRNMSKLAVCYLNDHNMPEPLFSLWEPKATASIITFQESGKRSPREFLQTHDVDLIQALDSRVLININKKDEYNQYLSEE